METLKIKRLRAEASLPQRQTDGSAGFDLHACLDAPTSLNPGETCVVPTGLAAEIPAGYAGMIFTRSGLGVKHGIVVKNGVGVIDSDYRGELRVALFNCDSEPYTLTPGERVAQLVLLPVGLFPVVEAEELDETTRGTGGFGSTGSH